MSRLSSPVREYAVKFGRHPDMGLESEKAFPFIYTFRNRNDDAWTAGTTLTNQSDAISNIVNGIGPLVPANSRITHNVMLDADNIFKLLYIKYNACYVKTFEERGGTEKYEWYDTTPTITVPLKSGSANAAVSTTDTTLTDTRLTLLGLGLPENVYVGLTLSCNGKTMTVTSYTNNTYTGTGWSGGGNPGNGFAWTSSTTNPVGIGTDGLDPDMNITGTPLSKFISITLSFSGSQAQILYGGDDCGPVPRLLLGSRREPLQVSSIQGYDYGFLALRTPKLLTQQACLIFDITNTHPTKDLVVGAAIYGMKIRM